MNSPQLLGTLTAVICCVSPVAVADVFSFTGLNLAIPDGQPAGISDVETISSGISQLESVQVNLNITGNFNGDLYCYLEYNSALAVLLNRPGRTVSNSFGYDDSGFNVTLSDDAANGNIHVYRNVVTPTPGSPLTGVWQPDGRTTSPDHVLDTDPSAAPLGVFAGMSASGTWTLFIADLSPGGTSMLNSWQLIITPVPEPSVLPLAALGLGVVSVLVRRRER
jgi:subtilisin-like proprotein convertase family protein